MKNRNLSSRAARGAGVIGVSAIAVASGLAVAAAPASASPYATGWQCISPFANYTNADYPGDEPAPNGILDSLDVSVTRQAGKPLTAVAGEQLPLSDVTLGVELKDPRVGAALYTETAGISVSYRGVPYGQPLADATPRTLSKVTIAAVPAATTINGGGTAPAVGESWWAFTQTLTAPAPADLNSGWYADGVASSTGRFTRTYYTEKVDGTNAPRSNAGSGIGATASLGHHYVSHTGNNHFPLNGFVVLEGTNTVEKYQTVQAKGYWTVNVEDSSPGSATNPAGYSDGGHTVKTPKVELEVPRTNWTPTGAGPVEFRVAEPGHSTTVQIESKGYDRPGYNRPVNVKPFGSVFLRADTEAYGASNDCVPGTVSILDSTIAASFWGDARPDATADDPDTTIGSVDKPGFVLNNQGTQYNAVKGAAGRYAFGFVAQPALAVAQLPAAPAPAPGPAPAPAPAPKATSPLAVAVSVLKKAKSNTISLPVSNPNKGLVRFKVSAKTNGKHRIGKRSPKTITVVTAKTFSVNGGKSRTVALRLTRDARKLLAARSAVKITVTIAPAKAGDAPTTTKKLTLKR